jgi:hypothetical protein
MRWFILLLNIAAATFFLFLGAIGQAKSQSFVHVIHREMETQGMIKVDYSESAEGTPNVRAELRQIARANYQSELSMLAMFACLLNGVIYFFSFPSGRRKEAARPQSRVSSAATSSAQRRP